MFLSCTPMSNPYELHKKRLHLFILDSWLICLIMHSLFLNNTPWNLQLQENIFPRSLLSLVFSYYWNHLLRVIRELCSCLERKGRDEMVCGSLNLSCSSAVYAKRLHVEDIMQGTRNTGTLQMVLLLLPQNQTKESWKSALF